MHTTLSLKKCLPVLLATSLALLTGCGITTKKTFLGEPVEKNAGTLPPMTPSTARAGSDDLVRNPALDAEAAGTMGRVRSFFTPYRINIQQGNFISYEMLDRVQIGMTREQVRFALGTPLITDIFRDNRWDYAFRLQKPDGSLINNRVVVFFSDNRVTRINHDPLLHEAEFIDLIMTPTSKRRKRTLRVAPVAPDVTSYAGDPEDLYEGVVFDTDDPIAQIYEIDARRSAAQADGRTVPGTRPPAYHEPILPAKSEIVPVLIPAPAPLLEEEPVAMHEEAITVHEEPAVSPPRPAPDDTIRPEPVDAEPAYLPEETAPVAAPAPVPVPAPVVETPVATPAPKPEPAPVVETPVPAPAPEPVPAPVVETPVAAPAPKPEPAPVVEPPAPAPAPKTAPATVAEPAVPAPAPQVAPADAAVPAGSDAAGEEYEDFQAAPRSVIQLQQLMQSR